MFFGSRDSGVEVEESYSDLSSERLLATSRGGYSTSIVSFHFIGVMLELILQGCFHKGRGDNLIWLTVDIWVLQ